MSVAYMYRLPSSAVGSVYLVPRIVATRGAALGRSQPSGMVLTPKRYTLLEGTLPNGPVSPAVGLPRGSTPAPVQLASVITVNSSCWARSEAVPRAGRNAGR